MLSGNKVRILYVEELMGGLQDTAYDIYGIENVGDL